MNNRRKLLVALGASALAVPRRAFAQVAGEIPRVAYIFLDRSSVFWEVFREQLRGLGYVDGSNIIFVPRDAEGRRERAEVIIRELVRQKVSILIALDNGVINAARTATKTIPILMVSSIDPVAAGYVASLARPGGNITGIASLTRELSAKRIELIREIYPKLTRLAILWVDGTGSRIAFQNYADTARALKLRAQSLEIYREKPDWEGAFRAAKTQGAELMIVVSSPFMLANRKSILALAVRNRLPSMVEHTDWMNDGGLISYGPSRPEIARTLAAFVDRILKGAKPANLPVEQPTQFELVINMRTAKALGIKIPQSILVRADRVIE